LISFSTLVVFGIFDYWGIMHFYGYYSIYSEGYPLLKFQSLSYDEPYFANHLPFSHFGTFSTVSTACDIVPEGDTRRWAGRDEADLTENVRVGNFLMV